jgi:hypothetical protein
MIWLLSFLLCSVLFTGILFLLMPDLFPEFLTRRWRKNFHYFRY